MSARTPIPPADGVYPAPFQISDAGWGGSEAQIKLQARAEAVDLDRLGLDATHDMPMIDEMLVDLKISTSYLKRVTIAQALMDNLSNTEGGLCVRWLFPDIDFTDAQDRTITQRDWLFPANDSSYTIGKWNARQRTPFPPNYKDPEKPTPDEKRRYDRYLMEFEESLLHFEEPQDRWRNQVQILQTSTSSRNDRKVILIFGVGIGYRTDHLATSLVVKRSDVKTITIVSLAHMRVGEVATLPMPVLYKRSDDCAIHVTLADTEWGRQKDQIVIYGFVAEAIGSQVTG